MPFNVCPDCGAWTVEKRVEPDAEGWAVAICPACGGRRRFRRLPLYVVSGASGTGKTTVMHELMHSLPGHIVLESDILWGTVPPDGPGEFHSYFSLWLRMVIAIAQAGTPVVLCGTALPEQLEPLPERRYIAKIHYAALVCDELIQRERLLARPAWRQASDEEWLRIQAAFNVDLRKSGPGMTPPMTVFDTTDESPKETAHRVRAWIQERR